MTEDMKKAVRLLKENQYTCVLVRGEREHHSTLRGVRPLLDLLDQEGTLEGFSAADKTVGVGAAHLYLLLGVSGVWANVMSERAERLLSAHGVPVFCDQTVPYIINRAKDGMCPIEAAVGDITCPEEALAVIREAVKKLQRQ